MRDLPCPACGFLTLEDAYGSFVICQICGWEDDGVQLANPTSAGGANRESLQDAQWKAIAEHPIDVSQTSGYCRSQSWRPLSTTEQEFFEARRLIKHWHSQGITDECNAYWSTPMGDVGQ